MLEIETLQTFDTIYSADSVEWCQDVEHENYFVVGTYQLEEKDANDSSNNLRKGRIYLFHYDEDINVLTECQQLELPEAVLDQKWMNFTNLVTATSSGAIKTYQFGSDNELKLSQEICLSSESSSDTLALSVDIDDCLKKVITSDSKGKLTVLDLEATQPIVQQWNAHDFEAWTCAFDRFNKNIVFSGGDDSLMKVWDMRTDTSPLTLKGTRREAGVTSMLSHDENLLLLGSYDEKLSSYDLRSLKQPLDELHLNGGIWRIKPWSGNRNLLVVACMYHNFSIVDCTTGLKLTGEYFGHESICYGCDWAPKSSDHFGTFASCSFYDHKLAVCKVKF